MRESTAKIIKNYIEKHNISMNLFSTYMGISEIELHVKLNSNLWSIDDIIKLQKLGVMKKLTWTKLSNNTTPIPTIDDDTISINDW